MNLARHNHSQLSKCLQNCLSEFKQINHYWDEQRQSVIAKILPGEFYMTKDKVAIATTLGSCISACIWDSNLGIGGMNHFMLPMTNKAEHEVDWAKRGVASDATRYGNFAMEHLINLILKHGGQRRYLKAKIFGGSKVFKKMSNVGDKNIKFVQHYLTMENITLVDADIGSEYPRKVIFEPFSGRAFVKKLDSLHNDTISRRESDYGYKIEHSNVEGDIELF